MRNKWHCLFLLLTVPLSIASGGFAQKVDESLPQHWVNLPSAPLRIGPSRSEPCCGYSLANYSNVGTIVRYKFGCVSQNGKKTAIVSEWPSKDVRFPPLLPGRIFPTEGIEVTASHGFPLATCKRGKLAVVEVEYEDGGLWRASR